MLVSGKNVCRDILKNNSVVKKIYLVDNFADNEIISLIEKLNLKIDYRSKKQIDDLCSGNNQGIILDIPDYEYGTLDDVTGDFVVMLDHLEDPHNLGAIIRTCEAAGVKCVTDAATAWWSRTGREPSCAITARSICLKKRGFWVVGTSLSDRSVDYRTIDYSGKIALIIGNEGSGITNLVSKKCDFIAKIPMYGETNSLNASVAAGIMIYEIIRNRK